MPSRPQTVDEERLPTSVVYCLKSAASPGKTYVGCTNNFVRRLRQHNGSISGGARFTKQNRPWVPVFVVAGLTKREALQLEWAIKHRRVPRLVGVNGRMATLKRLMTQVDRWTRHAPPRREVARRIKVHVF